MPRWKPPGYGKTVRPVVCDNVNFTLSRIPPVTASEWGIPEAAGEIAGVQGRPHERAEVVTRHP